LIEPKKNDGKYPVALIFFVKKNHNIRARFQVFYFFKKEISLCEKNKLSFRLVDGKAF
jgi:hypothetical protein